MVRICPSVRLDSLGSMDSIDISSRIATGANATIGSIAARIGPHTGAGAGAPYAVRPADSAPSISAPR